jgi:drug/metabolite transporter (DMT)-like permease
MVAFGFLGRELEYLGRRDLTLVGISGIFLSLHSTTLILAVKDTTVANATFLVNTSPVMLAVLAPLIIKERMTTREGLGVLVATFGVLLVAYAGNGFHAFGLADISALLSAFFVAVYSLVGRFLRTSGVSTVCYTSYVYSIAALVSLTFAEMLNAPVVQAYDTFNVLAILGLALVPTMLGHTLYNHSLKSVKSFSANLFPLLEPIIASLFAVPLFGEVPTLTQISGYLLILVAVVIVVTGFR